MSEPDHGGGEPEESALVDAAAQGDLEAFGELAKRHQRRVFRLVASVLGPGGVAEAEEVTQDALLQALEKLPGLRDRERFGSWLNRIAWRRAIDRKRTARHRLPHLPAEALESLADESQDPEAAARERRRRLRVEACLARFPVVYRSVLYQRYWLDASVGEIAAVLGVPEGTVKSYLFRGRQRLKKELARQGFNDD